MNASNTPRSFIRPYYAALNGLRGVAILMVFFAHYGILIMPERHALKFWPGVDLFFVVSGFLITGILFDSKNDPDYFKGFYIRRALRIFPLYYAFFVAVLLLTPVLRLTYSRYMWSYLVYAGNLVLAHSNNALTANNPTPIWIGVITSKRLCLTIGHFWSLCIEEQFYMVWPLLIWLIPSRKLMIRLCAVAMVAALCFRIFLVLHSPARLATTHFLYYLTLAHSDGLLAGSWVALWLRGVELSPRRLRQIAWPLIGICSGIITVGAYTIGTRWPPNEVNPLVCTYGYTLIAGVAVGVLLLALDEESWVHKLLLNGALAKLGIVSYGFYLIHELYAVSLVATVQSFHWRWITSFGVVVAIFAFTYLAAWVSFRYFESFFLRLKKKLAPSRARTLIDERVIASVSHERDEMPSLMV